MIPIYLRLSYFCIDDLYDARKKSNDCFSEYIYVYINICVVIYMFSFLLHVGTESIKYLFL